MKNTAMLALLLAVSHYTDCNYFASIVNGTNLSEESGLQTVQASLFEQEKLIDIQACCNKQCLCWAY
jgi:hypothetical protein